MGSQAQYLLSIRSHHYIIMQLHMLTLATVMVTMVSSSNVHTRDNTRDLMCDICQDIVRDLDEWITSDSTIDEIVHFAEGLCDGLGWIGQDLADMCKQLIDDNLPDIINGLVNDNLAPEQICANIGWCYTPPPTTAAPAKFANLE